MSFQENDFLEEIDNSSRARNIPLRKFKEKPEDREKRISELIKKYEQEEKSKEKP